MAHKDWIERDEKDFVYRSKEHRSGWDKGRSSMTDYLLEPHQIPVGKEFEIRKAYQLCNDRAAILSEKPTRVIFSEKEETGHTDGKRVFVSTKVIDDHKTFIEKSDILLGITTHEMAHIMHTDFEPLKKLDRFTHTVWNIIEDERIEHKIGEEFPGYAGNLAAVKQYFFKEKYMLDKERQKELENEMAAKAAARELEAEEEARKAGIPYVPPPKPEPLSPEDQQKLEVYDLFFKFVRFPEMIDADKVAEHEVMIDELKKILTPYPTKSHEVLDAAKDVAEVLRKSWDDIEPPPSAGKGKGVPGGKHTPGGSHRVEGIIEEAMTFAMSDNEEGTEKEKESASDLAEIDYEEAVIDDKLNEVIFRNAVPNEAKYRSWLSAVKGDAHLLARKLYLKTFSEMKHIRGMRSGLLDDNRIVEAVHGVKTVYTHKIDKIEKKLNMTLLIDESGSMGDGVKSANAAKAAILLEQTYKLLPMGQLFIYGFTSDIDEDEPYFNRVIRYKEPGFETKYGLGDVQGRCNNRDGMCIRAVVNRVRAFTREPMLLFVISDGQPAASGSYYGMGGIHDTRKAVQEAAARNFFPIQIGIGVDPSVQKMMFDDFVTYKDSKTMVEDLRKLLLSKAHKFIGI
jgi:hypothetical protein